MTKESKLCKCGCGDYTKPGNKYINGHNNRNGIALEKTRKKMQEAQIKFFKDPLEREKRSATAIKYYEENSVSDKTRKKQAEAAIKRYEDPLEREKKSATSQGISYDEWEGFASEQPYCPAFNEACRESNREKYDRRCFLTGLPENENLTKTGKQRHLSVHHYDMDKMQGCDGKRWKLVPLCMEMHGRAHTKLWETRIMWLLDNVWNKD